MDTKILWWLGFLIALVYAGGLMVPLMDNDSAHHAVIGLNMHLTGNYAFLVDIGQPYLDKPHLLFWTAALFYKLMGVNTLAYKLPSFLFTLLAIYSTYRLGSLLYNKQAGKLAAFILSTACAFVLANNDVRMEGLLTGSIIFSIWQLCAYVEYRKWLYLVLAALGLAMGFATKGMIGVVIPAVALFLHLVYRRQWNMIFHWPWLVMVVLFAVFISPVVYSYYLQFDLHPETVVRGENNISGVRFILWDQNIDRMAGESHTQKSKDFFFFFHTFLWAFLPWSLLSALSIASGLKTAIKNRFAYVSGTEFLTVGTVAFFMIFFSFSKFKLPHYLNCLFPLFAIALAGYLAERHQNRSRLKLVWNVQLYSLILTVAVALVLCLWAFPVNNMLTGLLLFVTFGLWIGSAFIKKPLLERTLVFTLMGAVFIFCSLNFNTYPQILSYQAGNELAFKSRAEKIDPSEVYYFMSDDYSFSYDYYTGWIHQQATIDDIKEAQQKGEKVWIYTSGEGKSYLEENNVTLGKAYENKDYRVSILTPKFLNPNTRDQVLTTTWLIQLR